MSVGYMETYSEVNYWEKIGLFIGMRRYFLIHGGWTFGVIFLSATTWHSFYFIFHFSAKPWTLIAMRPRRRSPRACWTWPSSQPTRPSWSTSSRSGRTIIPSIISCSVSLSFQSSYRWVQQIDFVIKGAAFDGFEALSSGDVVDDFPRCMCFKIGISPPNVKNIPDRPFHDCIASK